MYCSNCGNKIGEKAVVCVKCGALVNGKNVSSPVKGKSIASMVLGILGILFALNTISTYSLYFSENIFEYILIPATLAIISICLAGSARRVEKNGFNTAGFWLSISTFIILGIIFLIALVY